MVISLVFIILIETLVTDYVTAVMMAKELLVTLMTGTLGDDRDSDAGDRRS